MIHTQRQKLLESGLHQIGAEFCHAIKAQDLCEVVVMDEEEEEEEEEEES